MKKISLLTAALAVSVSTAAVTVCDFEQYAVGQTVTVWNYWNSPIETTAVVEVDPANPSNKVLHVTNKNWNDYVELELPSAVNTGLIGLTLNRVKVDIRRHASDPCGEWKHFDVLLGPEKLYEDDGWPSYGPVSTWSTHEYAIAAPAAETIPIQLHLGFNSDNSEYYIDNVIICGEHDDYEVIESGELNFSDPNSNSSAYTAYSTPLNIPADKSLKVYTSRYTYFKSPIIGSGPLSIYGGGERVYIGNEKGAVIPDWSGYTGDVDIYPWPEVNPAVTAGNYGVTLGHGGYKFNSDDIRSSIAQGGYTPLLENNRVTIRPGATVQTEGNNTARAFRMGELTMEPGSVLTGHFKTSGYRTYYLVGCLGTDAILAGKITPVGTSIVGLVKEGKGTYTITGNENNISGGLSVIGGKVMIANDVEAARTGKLSGPVGSVAPTTAAVSVYRGGELGGTGHISGTTDLYGHLCPGGADAPGTLTIADYTSAARAFDLRLRPSARIIFRVNGSDASDRLDISGALSYYNIGEDLQTSDATPVLEIAVPEGHTLKAGDEFTLITAASKSSLAGGDWSFRIQYPTVATWVVTEQTVDGVYSIKAKVTSLDYSGQGDTIVQDGTGSSASGNDDYLVDYTSDYADSRPLRALAQGIGKSIGVAVPAWKYALDNDSDDMTRLLSSEFNAVVAENEMKIDATEPSRGTFEFGNADKLVSMAGRNGLDVRGHTLVWHQQVPSWISSDGKKNSNNFSRSELIAIMNAHIDGVASHFAGRVREWDVVNECLDDDQSVVRNDPTTYKLRPSVWQLGIGDDFVALAFERAHQADPAAELYLNDYGVEYMGNAKAEALYNLARKLVEQGVPIHGVGLQCHLTTGETDAARLAANIRRYQELGLKCIVTELDIAQAKPKAPDAAETQAREYGAIVKAALLQPNCPTVMIWGVKDTDSWRENNPLIYDGSLNRKEAYYAVHAALREVAEESGIVDITAPSEAEPVAEEYYNLQGHRVAPTATGILIIRTLYSDGTVTTQKVLR